MKANKVKLKVIVLLLRGKIFQMDKCERKVEMTVLLTNKDGTLLMMR